MTEAFAAVPGFAFRDHLLKAPLDWSQPEGERIDLFAREICDPTKVRAELPLLLFLQGGPGGKSPRPGAGPGWMAQACKTHRVVLLDQRGTGRSSAVEGRDMARFATGEAGARHLSCFLADSIVKDAELIRKSVYGGRRWSTLGQSYGGFLTLTYLSFAPEALERCYVTGGLSGVETSAEEVYRRTWPRVLSKNAQYAERYPEDSAILNRIADLLASEEVRLSDGDRLTPRRLQHLGLTGLGMTGGFETLHWLLDEAFRAEGALSESFLAQVRGLTAYDQGPLYMALQEAIYPQVSGPPRWAADRVQKEFAELAPEARPLLLTGESVHPWMFEEIRALRPFQAAAEALAQMEIDRPFYDPARLAANEVPVHAAVYLDDMYVDMELSLQTARSLGAARLWITNEHEHNGLRQSASVLARLMAMETGLEGRNF